MATTAERAELFREYRRERQRMKDATQEKLAKAIAAIINECCEEYGFGPSAIRVEMGEATRFKDETKQFALVGVHVEFTQ